MGLLGKLRTYAGVLRGRQSSGPMEPTALAAKRRPVQFGVGMMELAQMSAGRVEAPLKALAQIKTSALVGCPF